MIIVPAGIVVHNHKQRLVPTFARTQSFVDILSPSLFRSATAVHATKRIDLTFWQRSPFAMSEQGWSAASAAQFSQVNEGNFPAAASL